VNISVTHIDTACIILDINDYRILTDPVLGGAGKLHHFGYGAISRKISNPAFKVEEIGPIDLVLLSHHQHPDNFDVEGKRLTRNVPLVISTRKAAKKLSNAVGLDPWQTYEILTAKVPGLRITATPARHHPWWLPKFFSGDVTGFIIEYENQSQGVIYITGDTVLFDELNAIGDKFSIDLAILHLGLVRFPYLTGPGKYTMSSADGVILAEKLQANRVIPIHTKGWLHFKEPEDKAKAVFATSTVANKTLWLITGEKTEL